jgi:hypothetical protein
MPFKYLSDVSSVLFCLNCFIFLQFLLQITCGCSTDGPECESSREYEGQDAELEQAARSHLGSRVFLRVSDPANLANRTNLNNAYRTKSV